jgi:hypothetical protein
MFYVLLTRLASRVKMMESNKSMSVEPEVWDVKTAVR